MPSGRHSLGSVTNHLDGLLEKALGCLQISRLTEQGIDQVAIPIDGAGEAAPLPFDVEIRFIDVPGPACLSTALDPQLVGHERGKGCFPFSDRLVREHKAPLQKHLGQIPQAQFGP